MDFIYESLLNPFYIKSSQQVRCNLIAKDIKEGLLTYDMLCKPEYREDALYVIYSLIDNDLNIFDDAYYKKILTSHTPLTKVDSDPDNTQRIQLLCQSWVGKDACIVVWKCPLYFPFPFIVNNFTKYIYVDKSWAEIIILNDLTLNALKIIILHEVEHIHRTWVIVLNHLIWFSLLWWMYPFIWKMIFITIIYKVTISRWIMLYEERQADINTVKKMGTSSGAINMFNILKTINENTKLILGSMGPYFYSPDGTYRFDFLHPSPTERIHYCKNVEKIE